MRKTQILDKKELKKFGFITGFLFAGLFGLLIPILHSQIYPIWPWVVAITLWTLTLFTPFLLHPIYKIWMKIGLVLGWINTRIILGVVFFVIITPIGLLMLIIKRDLMAQKFDRDAQSYRVISRPTSCDKMERPF